MNENLRNSIKLNMTTRHME